MTKTFFSPKLDQLIESLRCLPGIGPKSAQRMAFYLLERNRHGGLHLATALQTALTEIQHCQSCRNFSETALCQFCTNPNRDPNVLCVVETPADVVAIEQTSHYRGQYFVLQGRLSPLDGIGPTELGLNQFVERLQHTPLKEVILATNPTVEGEVTAHHIAKLLKPFPIKITRLAHGIPLGSELEFAGDPTLIQALKARTEMTVE